MTPQSRLLVGFESFTLSFSNQRSTALLLKVLQIPSFEGRPLFLSLGLLLGVEPRQGVSLREAYRKLFQGLPGFPPHCHLVVKLCQEHLFIPFVLLFFLNDIMCMCVCPYLQMDSEKLWTPPGHMLVFPLDFEEKVE